MNSSVLCPYISVQGAADAIAFYKKAFGAVENFRLTDPSDGRIGHAEISLGDAVVMISDEYPDFGAISPATLGGTPVTLHLRVEDVDKVFPKALAAGATELRPVKDQFFGERSGMLEDPFGHCWVISTTTEDISADEMQKRWTQALSEH